MKFGAVVLYVDDVPAVLRFYEDMTVPQVAAELGLAQGSVKRYLSDAVKRLEHHLGPLADAHHIDLDVTHGGAR